MKLMGKARAFAIVAHEGQFRKDGITPYVTHPLRVVNRLERLGMANEDILCAAYLHDVIEDCNVSREQIAYEFNPNISRIVSLLSRDVSRSEYKERIKSADYQTQIVKLADVLDNCEDLNKDLPERVIRNKINDCNDFYLDLASRISNPIYGGLVESVARAEKLV